MSKSQTLRTLVNERLTAAAEEIFSLFETTIAAYEEELCRFKEENQRKQQLLDCARADLNPGVWQQRVATPVPSAFPNFASEITQVVVKEECGVNISVKQEEEESLVPVPESSDVYVKREEASSLQRGQTEQNRETWGNETQLHLERLGDTLHIKQEEEELLVPVPEFSVCVKREDASSPQRGQTEQNKETWGNETQLHLERQGGTLHRKQEDEELQGPFPESSVVYVKREEASRLQMGQTEQNKDTWGNETQLHLERQGGSLHQKQEDEELQGPFPESSVVYVKREEASRLQMGQTEQNKDTWGEETHLHLERQGHTLQRPLNFLCEQKDARVDGEHYTNQSVPETNLTGTSGERSEKKKHQCSVCKKQFTRKQHLDLHRRVHSGEKPFSCTVCSRTFALKGTLEVHMRTHTGERPYCCPICKKTFTQTSALNSHRRTHTGEKPFGCPTCKKTFGQKVHLEVHMRSHTGERPYCCSFCNKPFADSYNLKIHMRVHTGEKPYRCTVCQKGFTVSSNLRAHERTHT